MTLAVADKPESKTGTQWRETIARAVHIFGHLDSWLEKPPAATPLDDLLAVKSQIDPSSSTPGALLVKTLSMLPVLFRQMTGKKPSVFDQSQRPSSEDISSARRWASSVAGEQKRDEVEELVSTFLDAIDREILRQLDDGVEDDRLIHSADFVGLRGNGLILLERGDGAHLQAGMLRCLPESHFIRDWPPEFLYEYDGSPCVILGLSTQGVFGGPGPARSYYLAASAEQWTRSARLKQLRERKESPHLDPDQYREVVEILRKVETKLPPRPSSGSPDQPVPQPTDWKAKTLLALNTLRSPQRVFVGPEEGMEGTPITDLLAVRELLGVREDDRNPNQAAAKRFASRAVGEVRKTELVELLHPFLNAIDRAAVLRIDRALLYLDRISGSQTR